MSVRSKIVLVILLAAVIPVSVSAWTTLGTHQTAFEGKIRELNQSSARNAAAVVHARFEASVRALSGVVEKAVRWPELSLDEREGAMWLTLSQLDMVAVVSIRNHTGALLPPVVYLDQEANTASPEMQQWASHPKVDGATVEQFVKLPKADYRRTPTQTLGRAFSENPVLLPVAFWVPGAVDNEPWTLEVALALTEICEEMIAQRPADTDAYLVDDEGRVLCTSQSVPPMKVDRALASAVSSISVAPGKATELRYPRGGDERIAAIAPAEGNWYVVIERSLDDALAPSRTLFNQSMLWIALGLLLAVIGGAILSGGITSPIRQLETGANQVAAGNLEHRIDLESADEFGNLASAFNAMGEEIATWNRELNERVQSQTKELQEAQEQLLEARKMGAMASLSAGIAHELNNPLAGLIGLTQVLVAKAKFQPDAAADVDTLEAVEQQAQRMAQIVAQLGDLETASSQGLAEQSLRELVEERIDAARTRLEASSIECSFQAEEQLPLVAMDEKRLGDAIDAILDNAIKAMSEGGRLNVIVRQVAGELVVLEISDTGPGIREADLDRVFEPFFATKEHWEGTGLGLSLAHQTVSAHNGRVSIKSEQKVGTTVTISLPASKGAAHLV